MHCRSSKSTFHTVQNKSKFHAWKTRVAFIHAKQKYILYRACIIKTFHTLHLAKVHCMHSKVHFILYTLHSIRAFHALYLCRKIATNWRSKIKLYSLILEVSSILYNRALFVLIYSIGCKCLEKQLLKKCIADYV